MTDIILCRGDSAKFLDTDLGAEIINECENIWVVNDWSRHWVEDDPTPIYPDNLKPAFSKCIQCLRVPKQVGPGDVAFADSQAADKIYREMIFASSLKRKEQAFNRFLSIGEGPTQLEDVLRYDLENLAGSSRPLRDDDRLPMASAYLQNNPDFAPQAAAMEFIWSTGDCGLRTLVCVLGNLALRGLHSRESEIVVIGIDLWEGLHYMHPGTSGRIREKEENLTKRRCSKHNKILDGHVNQSKKKTNFHLGREVLAKNIVTALEAFPQVKITFYTKSLTLLEAIMKARARNIHGIAV
tara:strand:+ start:332 stop:1222 length:891 start_codon:yes stop_codon:yes gene_type:complete